MNNTNSMPTEINLGFVQYLLAAGALVGTTGWLISTIKGPTATQRIQLEQLKKQRVEEEKSAFTQKAAVIGGIAVLMLIGLKKLKRR